MSEQTRSELKVWLPTVMWMLGTLAIIICLGFFFGFVVSLFAAAIVITALGAWLDFSGFE